MPPDRWRPPRRYSEQLIVIAEPEVGRFVRERAARKHASISSTLRDLVQRGIDTLKAGRAYIPDVPVADLLEKQRVVSHYPKQLIVMTTPEVARFVRSRAARKGVHVSDILRDLVIRGIGTLDEVHPNEACPAAYDADVTRDDIHDTGERYPPGA
jgi:hypothetical protein